MLELIVLGLVIGALVGAVAFLAWSARGEVLVPEHDHVFDQMVGDGKGWRCSVCAEHGVYIYKGKG